MSEGDPRAAWAAMQQNVIHEVRTHGRPITGPFAGRDVLLLTTTGARSGEPRLAPVVFTRDGDRFVIVASKGGAPTNPAWYANLRADPIVTVETGGETFQAKATTVHGPERDRLYAAHADVHPTFNDYQRRTERVIPVVVLERI